MKTPALVAFLLLQAGFLMGQLGGRQSFEFLNIPVGARVAAMGGVIMSATESDVNLFLSNPSLLDSANHNHVSWSHFGFYADIKYNTFAYARNLGKLGLFGIGVQHMGYGDFDRYDAVGNATGTFGVNETALVISKSHQISSFRMGANLKFINSNMDTFGASAVAVDVGGSFIHPNQELVVSVLFKNLGVVLSDFSGTDDSDLPTDLQVGVTFKPEHTPFRVTFTAYNLNKSNTTYYDEDFERGQDKPGFADGVFRHLNVGLELILSENINIRAGYNQRIRKELRLDEKAGLTGISFGFMAKIKAFELSYSLATYQVSSGRSYFTITSNLNRVFKRKSII